MKPLKLAILFVFSIVTYSSSIAQFDNLTKEPISITNDPLNLIHGSLNKKERNKYINEIKSSTPTTNSGSWTNQYGPYGIAGAYGIAAESDTGNLVFAATFRGLLRSTNGGNSWQYIGGFEIVNPEGVFENGPISEIAIDPTNSNKIIAGYSDQFQKVFISEDRGITWTAINHPSSTLCIDISKTNHNRVVTGSNAFNFQLAKSADGGYTWSQIPLNGTITGRVWSIRFHPLDANKIFAGGEHGLFYSADFGNTWIELNNGIPNIDYISIKSIEFSPTNSDSIVISCSSNHGPYISGDGGASWSEIRNNLWQYELCWDATFPKWNSDQLYIGTYYYGMFKCSLPTVNWQPVSQLNNLDPGSVEDIETTNNQKIFVGSRYNGVFRSADGGTTYEEANNGATCANMRTVKINPNNINEALCAGWSGGIYKTVDRGHSWQKKYSNLWLSIDIANTNSQICFAAGNGIQIAKSINGGDTWDWSSNGITSGQFIKVAIDPQDASHVIALSHYGADYTVYQTYDAGELWQPVSGIPSNAGAYYIHEVVFDYQNTPFIYVGTDNGLFYSTNNGQSWLQAYPGSPESMGLTTLNNLPILYGLSETSVFYSSDHGLSWSVLFNSPNGNNLRQCNFNKLNSNEIIIFDEDCICSYSTDGGQSWEDQSSGIPYDIIENIDVNFEYKTRYIATQGRGIFTWIDSTTYSITASCNPVAGGSASGGGTYYHWQTCTTIATPAVGYAFINWTEEDSIVSTNTTYSFIVYDNRNLIANFDTATFNITATANPINGGNVTGSGVYPYGQVVNLIASSNYGFDFLNWTEDGIQVSTDSIYSFLVEENRVLTANFTINLSVFKPNQDKVTINIYPNPSNNFIYVDLGNLNVVDQDVKTELYDLLGKPIAINTTLTDKSILNFDFTGIQSGIYYLIVKSNGNVLGIKKVIVMK